ncbi:transmembrane protein, putative (macronuclear) [Tetrahymena thermophila SB210]|uniref:Transmembrane protein, putative n=1 Tax=Tetrahymena thermophila (strain SB210) TaxID=312017 RepID=W7X319_TETTS|nr:transmembrane protein, putative [Tetrahymena thermophila SB210]EWS71842.1 transmembrane protein, putative [Tetrahymena thermophila SB210]|eukprot:XP_012655635.1 transmembrane protein, putative [Tetrahymena thermophila SB210]
MTCNLASIRNYITTIIHKFAATQSTILIKFKFTITTITAVTAVTTGATI